MDALAFLALLRRRAAALVLCLVAGIAGALVLTSQSTELYRATTRAYVDIPQGSTTVVTANQGQQLIADLLPSIAELASSRRVAEQVKTRLRLPESVGTVRNKLSASAKTGTLFIDLTAVDADPVRARSLADATAVAVSGVFAELQAGRPTNTVVALKQLDAATTPTTPFEPRPAYNLALGTALGLLSGLLLALLLDALDRTVKTAVQAETVTSSPVLGLLPKLKKGATGVITATDPDDPAAEAYRTLRTSVRFLDPDHPLQVLAVTSPSASEGKTTTAVNLAVALAQSGERVVLVDADLRRPSVASILGIEGAVGLTDVVTRTAALDDVLQQWGSLLTVLPSGPVPPNPSEIVGSQSMGSLLDELRERFDVVVVDAPPVLAVTDAVVLSTQVDGVLLVVRAGKTLRGLAIESRRRLDGVGAHVVGCVVNAVASSTAQGYYATYRHERTP
jgi:succinoglycan biosynthesis transport protein ExoP